MTREQAEKWINEITAFANGEEIEYQDKESNRWFAVHSPSWSCNTNYRVKPKWMPKQGEIIEVSMDKVGWEQREFICMAKIDYRYICFNTDGSYASTWSYARELQDD